MSKSKLVSNGVFAPVADLLMGQVTTGITAAGSDLAGATALTNDVNVVGTVAASTGVRLPASAEVGDVVFVHNLGANSLSVYPPTATGVIDGGAAGAAKAVAAGKGAMFRRVSATLWVALVGA